MNIPYFEIALLALLTAINGLISGCETAYISLREGQLQRLEDTDRGRKVVNLARNSSRFLSTCQIGITLASFFTSASAAVSLAKPLEGVLKSSVGKAAGPASFVAITLIVAYFTLVFGELVPKRIAMQRAERWAIVSADFLRILAQIVRPLIWLLEKSTNIVVRVLGADPHRQREEVTEEELRDLIELQDSVSEDQRSIIEGAFEVAGRTLREIVVPRNQVVDLDAQMPAREAVQILADAGHSRAPVHTGDLDDVLGIVHVRDLIDRDGPVAEQTRPATVLPESLGVLDALRRMQSTRQQMGIVVDEHGGVEGIVTVEDVLEEIVGEIWDEFDREVDAAIKDETDGTIVVPGTFPIHDLGDIGVELSQSDGGYATVAGFVLERLGHIPTIGEVATSRLWNVKVLEVVGRAITQVKLIPTNSREEEAER